MGSGAAGPQYFCPVINFQITDCLDLCPFVAQFSSNLSNCAQIICENPDKGKNPSQHDQNSENPPKVYKPDD